MTVTLEQLKSTRIKLGLTGTILAATSRIPIDRIKALETLDHYKRDEPWFDEAVRIARALGLDRIAPLITSGNLMECDLGQDIGDDARALRAGLRLPLSAACRLARQFHLPDPITLHAEPLTLQLWAIMEHNDRHPEAMGWCPWCAADLLGGEQHHPMCVPGNLWSRDFGLRESITEHPRPAAHAGGRGSSGHGHGLRAFRDSINDGAGITQRELAQAVGIDANHYARMERLDLPLTTRIAQRIAEHFQIDMLLLYRRPHEDHNSPVPAGGALDTSGEHVTLQRVAD